MHCYFSSPTVLCNALGIIEALSALVPLHIWYIQSLQYWCMPSSYGLTTLTSSSAFMFLPPLHFSFPSMFTMALATLTSTLLFSKMIVSMCLCHHDASFTLVTSCTTASTLETQPWLYLAQYSQPCMLPSLFAMLTSAQKGYCLARATSSRLPFQPQHLWGIDCYDCREMLTH